MQKLQILFGTFYTASIRKLIHINKGKTIKKEIRGIVFTVMVFCLLVFSCSSEQKGNSHDDYASVVRDFFEWYAGNYETMSGLDFAKPMQDSFYRIDFGQVEEYLALLRKAGVFSEKFIEDKIAFFRQGDSNLAIVRQTDGPAVGFESDLLLLSQEPEYLLDNRKEISTSVSKGKGGEHVVVAGYSGDTLVFTVGHSTGLVDSIFRR
ncbi:MAG: hypothetical protein KF744_05500 [Taibaiella sp.]|nr:hypothetical protein [Taibaiella sp.]